MEIWRIDTYHKSFTREPVPENWDPLGGRGLLDRILLDEVPPTCEPLGTKNKLIFAPGLLTGFGLSSCDRVSAGGKSPLTGGIKESNAGGTTGRHLARLGIKALILEGGAADREFSILVLSPEGARFEPAGEIAGLGVYQAAQQLREIYGDKVAMALIGPTGEDRALAAGISNVDVDGNPSRVCGRGGLGAVMGSKGIKAIIFDGSHSPAPEVADVELFKQARKQFTDALLNNPQVGIWRDLGTAGTVSMANMFGCFPTRNFRRGRFEQFEQINGENLRETILSRPKPGTPTHSCMAGCVVRCSNVLVDENGEEIVAPLEYETIGLIGGNLEIDSLDDIGRLNYLANDLGLDSIELGATLGVAAEAGLMTFGDSESAYKLVGEIYKNTPLGRILASGAVVTGKVYGVSRVPAVKGQAFAAYDPRALKGIGVTYATSPQGADHTAGFTLRAKVDHLDPTVNVNASRIAQINAAGVDTLGACSMVGAGFAATPTTLRDLFKSTLGRDVPENIQQVLGKEALTLEREFNRAAGFSAADDRLPEFLINETLLPKNSTFDVATEDLDTIFNW